MRAPGKLLSQLLSEKAVPNRTGHEIGTTSENRNPHRDTAARGHRPEAARKLVSVICSQAIPKGRILRKSKCIRHEGRHEPDTRVDTRVAHAFSKDPYYFLGVPINS